MSYAVPRRSFWRELRRSLEGCRPGLSLELCLFNTGFSLHLFGFFIPLLFLDRWRYEPYEMMERWGVYYFERSVVFCWGRRSKRVYCPWRYEQVRHEVLRPDGTWAKYVGSWEHDKEPDGRWTDSHPYRYTLRSGEIQERTATVYVERTEYRWRSLMWCPWPSRHYKTLDIQFSDEVGERTGSWKGGCIGCGYRMLPGESPLDTLRRMERERVFD